MTVTGGTALAHVDDIAKGIAVAIQRGQVGERYILGGENIHAHDITRLILECAGQKKWILRLPNGLTQALINGMARLRLPTPIHPDLLAHAVLYWFCRLLQSSARPGLPISTRERNDTICR